MDKAIFFTKRSLAFSCIFALLINFMVFGSTPAFSSTTFQVNLTTDAPDSNPGDGVCDTSEQNREQCTLRAAIMEANRVPGPDLIEVLSPNVDLTVDGPGGDEEGDLDITDTATTTIDGNGVVITWADPFTDRVFDIDDGAAAVIDDVTIEEAAQESGGGIFNSGELTLNRSTIRDSGAAAGGALLNTGNLTMTATDLTDNGAYYEGGGFLNAGFAQVTGGSISENGAQDIGGGIFNVGFLELDGTQVNLNTAGDGGGIYNGEVGEGFLIASDVEVNENRAEGGNECSGSFEDMSFDSDDDESAEICAQEEPHGNGEGGGIWNDSVLQMELSEVNDNVAVSGTGESFEGGEGGGIYNEGGIPTDFNTEQSFDDFVVCEELFFGGYFYGFGSTCLTEVELDGNVAQGEADPFEPAGFENGPAGKGGGIWNVSTEEQSAFLFVDQSDLTNNEAAEGGGLYNAFAFSYVTGTAFTGNSDGAQVTGTAGGGAYVTGSPRLREQFTTTFEASTFEANTADIGGGIYYGNSTGSNEVANSTFNNNRAISEGGGIWNDSDFDLFNSTVSGNRAGLAGGGLYNTCFNEGCGQVSSNAVTFYRNRLIDPQTSTAGVNVHDTTGLSVHFRMTILAKGFPSNCNTDGSGNFIDEGYNLDDDGTCSFEPQTATGSITGEDPMLAGLGDYGGPTKTHALLRNSPALDAVGAGCPPPGYDQRYFDRPGDADGDTETASACDIGAFEHQDDENFPSTAGGGGGGGSGPNDNGGENQPPDPDPSSPQPEPSASNPAPNPNPNPAPPARCAAAARQLGLNLVSGTHGDDVLRGTNKADVICAKAGDDEVKGLSGNDIIWLGAGDDHAVGGQGADTIRGGRGDDIVEGSLGGDEITLGEGRDFASGGGGNDRLFGLGDNDDLQGGSGNDGLYGDGGIDHCNGGPGTDTEHACDS